MVAEKGSTRLLKRYQGLIEKSLERILPKQYSKKDQLKKLAHFLTDRNI